MHVLDVLSAQLTEGDGPFCHLRVLVNFGQLSYRRDCDSVLLDVSYLRVEDGELIRSIIIMLYNINRRF